MMTLNVSCKSYLLLLFICVSSLHYTFGQDPNCPTATIIPNTVVFAGDSPTFTRAAGDGAAVQWQFASASATFNALQNVNTNPGDYTVDARYTSTFGLNSTQLTVFKATIAPEPNMPDATAGLYLINYPDGCVSAGGLVVIYGGPICGLDTSDPNNIQMSCSLNFSNYIQERLNPVMTYTNNGNQIFQEEPQPESLDIDNPGLQNSKSTYSLGTCSEGTYSCTITFSAPSTDTIPPFVSSNAPNFSASCTFPACASTTTQKPTTTTTLTTTTTQSPTTTTRSPTTTTQSPTTTTTQSPTTTIPPTQAPITTTTQSPTTTIQSPTTQSPSLTTQPPPPATTTTTASPATQAPSFTISTTTASPLSLISSILETTAAIAATDATATATTTSPAIATTSGSESGGLPLIIILGVVLGSLLATAAAVSCWCCCCVPVYPAGILPARRRRRRVIVRRIFFPWRREPIYQPRPQPPPPPPQKIYYVTEEVVLAPRYFPSYRTGAYNNQWLQRNSNASYTSYQPQYARYNKPEDVRYNSFRPAYYNYY